MRSRFEFSSVREIHILRDEKSFFGLRRILYFSVGLAGEAFFTRRLDILTELLQNWSDAGGQILVQLNFHRTCGVAGAGSSSSADAAAKAIAAWISAGCREG
jgi:hypothetical protein